MTLDPHAQKDGHESPELMDMSGEHEFKDAKMQKMRIEINYWVI